MEPLIESAIEELESHGVPVGEPNAVEINDKLSEEELVHSNSKKATTGAKYDGNEDSVEVFLPVARAEVVGDLKPESEDLLSLSKRVKDESPQEYKRNFSEVTEHITEALGELDKVNDVIMETALGDAIYKTIINSSEDFSDIIDQRDLEQTLSETVVTDVQHELVHRSQLYNSYPDIDNSFDSIRRKMKVSKVPVPEVGEPFAYFWEMYKNDTLDNEDERESLKQKLELYRGVGDTAVENAETIFSYYDHLHDSMDKSKEEAVEGVMRLSNTYFKHAVPNENTHSLKQFMQDKYKA